MIDFNKESDLEATMKEHGVDKLKDTTPLWKKTVVFIIKIILVFSLLYGFYKEGQWISNHIFK